MFFYFISTFFFSTDTINNLATKNYEADGGGSDDGGIRVDHVGFGVVQGKDKKRFKTRSGETGIL